VLNRSCLLVALTVALLAGPAGGTAVHEIPPHVVVQAFVKPEGQTLRLLVRVPLAAMRDVVFPLRGPGYLDIPAAGPALREAATMWIAQYVALYEEGTPLGELEVVAVRASLPSDPAFANYPTALAHISAPSLPAETDLAWEQAAVDILLEVAIGSDRSRFTIDPEWAHLGVRTATVLRFLPPDGGERALQYYGNPGRVRLDPRWHQAAFGFVRLGFWHILGGADHLLFILCLVLPFRRIIPLVAIVTSFTVAHSITLGASALGFAPSALWFPPLIEALIALSIVLMAFGNIVGARLERRWLVAFAFGLVHGFGFSFLLRDSLQFAGSHLMVSLFAFNVGVELGQILVLAVAVPLLVVLFKRVVPERMGIILISALVAHTAWHWAADRGAELWLHPIEWPALDLLFLAALMRWTMGGLLLVGVAWALSGALGRFVRKAPDVPEKGVAGAEA